MKYQNLRVKAVGSNQILSADETSGNPWCIMRNIVHLNYHYAIIWNRKDNKPTTEKFSCTRKSINKPIPLN